MSLLSVIIPSRVDEFLQKTVDDLFEKAEEDIEVIVVLDGYWPDPSLKDHPQVRVIHHGTLHNSRGMRDTINAGVAISTGKYIMKTDEHCMFDQGYDKKLKADCEENWVSIPRRYRLDAENWEIVKGDRRPPVDYMYLTYPYEDQFNWKNGLYGKLWVQRHYDKIDLEIDDLMSYQGSCYFMHRSHWDRIGGMSTEGYGPFNHEAQEIGNKTWLGGGRLIRNKKTWYAHYHKGSKGKKYGFSSAQYREFMAAKEKARQYCIDYWMNDKWEDRVHDFGWLVDKFMPIPGWPEDWRERRHEDEKWDWANRPDGVRFY